MTQFTGTHDRYDLATKGDNVREDLSDVIKNISPTDTPFISNIGSETIKSNYHEWLGDTLAAATTNKQIDGDEFAASTMTAAIRYGNYAQISWKVAVVSRRADQLTKAGRKTETAYQLAKLGKALKRDKEYILAGGVAPQAAAVGNSTSAPTTANLSSWVITNDTRASGGASATLSGTTYGNPSGAASDSTTTGAVSEAALLSLVADCYVAGGNPEMIMISPPMKQKISGYLFSSTAARVATQYQDQGKSPRGGASVLGAIDVWVTDFGSLDLVPNRFMRDRDIFILDPSTLAVGYIDDMKVVDIAQTGDATKKAILSDYTLICTAEAANAVYADRKLATAVVA
jgi:Family of unknown function (DUF5309)